MSDNQSIHKVDIESWPAAQHNAQTPPQISIALPGSPLAMFTQPGQPREAGGLGKIFINPLPKIIINLSNGARYFLSGALLMLGIMMFIMAVVVSERHGYGQWGRRFYIIDGSDWIAFIFSIIGWVIVALVDKSKLDDERNPKVARSAKIVAVIGLIFMLGGILAAVLVLAIKWQGHHFYGWAELVQAILALVSACLLWKAQKKEKELDYEIAI